MTALDQINRLTHQLPLEALQDIHQRITDWLAGGGGPDDHYIHQQLRYAKNLVRAGMK